MGKMMPLKWIEQAEAREVCVITLSEAAVAPEPPMALLSFMGSLLRLRARPAPSERERNDPNHRSTKSCRCAAYAARPGKPIGRGG